MSTPNIIFFFTDDQRFDTIGALGNDAIHTPNIDKLVARGTTFTHAHIMGGTCAAVCMPSRAMLMTSRTLYHLRGSGNHIPKSDILLGECLRQAGYQTFGTGKWHNGHEAYARSFSAGAEIFFGGMHDHWNVPACDFDPDGNYPERPSCPNQSSSNQISMGRADHIKCGKHSTELFADATIDFLNSRSSHKDKPFFAYVSFMAPHDPRTMPKKFLDMYPPEDVELPPNYMPGHPFDNGELYIRDEKLEAWPRTKNAVRKHIAQYYAMITHVDAEIGRVLRVLDQTGEADNTIIVFAGDNGLAVGRHGLMGKQSLYEHSVRVPLIFAGPGIPAGRKSAAYCYLLDIYPTICELTGTQAPPSVEGISLACAMQDPCLSVRPLLYCGYKDVQRSVRDARYKLIEYAVGANRTTQLFDLTEDPWELNNLADEPLSCSEVIRLRKEMLRLREELDDDQEELGRKFWQRIKVEAWSE